MVEYTELLQEAANKLNSAVFLMTGEGKPNPMTIGWGQWGRVWNIPVCTILVRQSRYSHEKLQEHPYFTVSIPAEGALKKELGHCGTVSGRDEDKLEKLGLTTLPARAGKVDALGGCAMHFECRVLMKLEMTKEAMADLPEVAARFYVPEEQAGSDGDPHTVYFGEILAAYRT